LKDDCTNTQCIHPLRKVKMFNHIFHDQQHWIQLAIFWTWTPNQPLIPTNISWRINSIPHNIIFINVPKLSHTLEGSLHEISLCTTSSTTIHNHKICNVPIIDLKVNRNSTNTRCFMCSIFLVKKIQNIHFQQWANHSKLWSPKPKPSPIPLVWTL
jgi:hypothetical protein